MDDRCAHRRFPLSRSTLQNDTIQCGYHGFTYGTDGRCLRVPNGSTSRAFKVRTYPVVERGPWVWVWTGMNPDDADRAAIPWQDRWDESGYLMTGYKSNPANYSMLHENLLDATHIEFLHGVPGVLDAGLKLVDLPDDEMPPGFEGIAVGNRFAQPDQALFSEVIPTGDTLGIMADKEAFAYFVSPALTFGQFDIHPKNPSETDLRRFFIIHCVTPATESETHQFWSYWQNVPYPNNDWQTMLGGIFDQDVEALGLVQEYVDRDSRTGNVERSSPSDAVGLRMRRSLQRMVEAEAAVSS